MLKDTKRPETEEKTWEGFEKFFATSVIRQSDQHAKMWFVAFVIMSIIAAISICGNIYQASESYSYDYYSQDGEGINNINTGEQGDLVNGAESENQEESEREQGN